MLLSVGALAYFGTKVEGDVLLESPAIIVRANVGGSPADYRAHGPYDLNLHILDCVRRHVQPETHFDDALKTMELIDAIYRRQI